MTGVLMEQDLLLNAHWYDYIPIVIYFAFVLGVGFVMKTKAKSSNEFLTGGRSMPAWVTGIAFVAANLGAVEIMGMSANGAQYGMPTFHYFWVGAVPAMIFLGLVMMPFYYGSKVRSVPEFMFKRFGTTAHLINSLSFALAQLLIAGINLFLLGKIINWLLGWPLWVALVVAAIIVFTYITLGGLSAAIYNEVLQFFVIVAALLPLTLIGLHRVGGWGGLTTQITDNALAAGTDPALQLKSWPGLLLSGFDSPVMSVIGIVFGLGFVLSFGYWTTNFTEVQRALSAKNLSAAERTPLIGAFPKIFIPGLTIIPGLIAVAIFSNIGQGDFKYDYAIPALMEHYLPNGTLGIAVAGMLAAFMAGMAANVSSLNTVFTYDIWQTYVKKNESDSYYLNVGRVVTIVGIIVGIGTAFIASQFNNIMVYIQSLFSFFNAPVFATFIIGMFWKRMTPWAGFFGLVSGFLAALAFQYLIGPNVAYFYSGQSFDGEINAQMVNFYGAMAAFAVDAVVTVIVTLFTTPRPVEELRGLVWGVPDPDAGDPHEGYVRKWYESPKVLGFTALGIVLVLSILFL